MSDPNPLLDELIADFPVGGTMLGVGIDIIEVDRIREIHERQKDRYLNRVYSEEELRYCMRMSNPYPHLAARFAVKEAVSKAFSTGIGGLFEWKSACVYHGERSQPLVELDEKGKTLLEAIGGTDVRITLSHTKETAVAMAVIVKEGVSSEATTDK